MAVQPGAYDVFIVMLAVRMKYLHSQPFRSYCTSSLKSKAIRVTKCICVQAPLVVSRRTTRL